MASPVENKLAVLMMILMFSLTFLVSQTVGYSVFSGGSTHEGLKQMKLVLGSSPPRCVNRCLSCRPCMPALVAPPHHKDSLIKTSYHGDESYYLLSWKCRCGNKLFQP